MSTKTSDWLAGLACVSVGVLIAALPHFIAWTKTGHPDYVASFDDMYYLAIGSRAYFNHPCFLTDPVHASGGPSIYRPLPLLPGIWAAKLFGLGPLGVGLMWRVLAGATVGLGWYLLFRLKVSRAGVAAFLSLILLSDPGLIHGTPLIRLFKRAVTYASLPRDSLIPGGDWIHIEWRSINPATTMVYLIALIWAILRARAAPTRSRIAVAGLTFGLLFHVYFYYWTAGGLALLLALVLDTRHRRLYFHAGWIGGLIGLPALLSDFLVRHGRPDDWLVRTDKFVPIGRFDELVLPTEILLVVALGLAFVMVRRRDLIFVWALGSAGLLLENHQVITRLQLDNYHWMYVWGPAFCCLILLAAVGAIEASTGWSPRACVSIGAVATLAFSAGLWIRAIEATRCMDRLAYARVIAAYRSEIRPDGTPRFTPSAVAAGDTDFVDLAAIFTNLRPLSGWTVHNSPSVTDAELDDRAALNDLLMGHGRSSFEARVRFDFENTYIGLVGRNRTLKAVRIADRLAAYDCARADLAVALNRFAVRYVGLPSGTKPPYLDQGWTLLSGGPTWDIWERITNPPTLRGTLLKPAR
jgi:hypothetical protein